MLNHIKSTEEANNTKCSLKFPVHHKNRRNESNKSMNNQNVPPMTLDDMEQIIIKAYHQAELLMNDLNLTETLKRNNFDDLEKLSLFVFR